jgi:hypothetical protein
MMNFHLLLILKAINHHLVILPDAMILLMAIFDPR